ncbi:MAG: ABC transporter permease [Bacteroidia bacterium]|nr:ABC transporter permease [Bacteroidia bacterium]MDW8157401.1 ABC transporter permease [Bacteroidia bacterium]
MLAKLPIASKIGGGVLFLYLLVIISSSAWLPDPSPYANTQNLELSQLPPLSKVEIIKIFLPVNYKNYEGGKYTEIALFPGEKPCIVEDTIFFRKYSGLRSWLLLPLVVLKIDKEDKQVASLLLTTGKPYEVQGNFLKWWDGTKWNVTSREDLASAFWKLHYQRKVYILGTDFYGRDVLSRLVKGGSYSLFVGLVSVFFSLLLGVGLGTLAGLIRGGVDYFIQGLMAVLWALPSLILAIGFSFVLGKGFLPLCLAIGLSIWVDMARVIRNELLSLREREFVISAKLMGFSSNHIFRQHLFPNLVGVILVYSCSNFGTAILLEAGLSFLGLGIAPPTPTWGNMIYEGYTYILLSQGKWLAFFPGAAIIILIISLYLLTGGLQNLHK